MGCEWIALERVMAVVSCTGLTGLNTNTTTPKIPALSQILHTAYHVASIHIRYAILQYGMLYLIYFWQVTVSIWCPHTKISLILHDRIGNGKNCFPFASYWWQFHLYICWNNALQCECPVETWSGSPKSFFSQAVCSAERGGGTSIVNIEQK